MSKLQNAVAKNAAAKKQTEVSRDPALKVGFEKYLATGAKEMVRYLQNAENAATLMQSFFDAARTNPALWDCSKESLVSCLMTSAKLGLYPGVGGECAYVPFKGEATFIPMYQGLIRLAFESGYVSKISAHVVYENDFFEYKLGLEEVLNHVPADGDRGKRKAVYAVISMKDGSKSFEVMFEKQINLIKAEIYSAGKEKSPWNTERDIDWMWKKTVLKQALKVVPRSSNLRVMLEHDGKIEAGKDSTLEILAQSEILEVRAKVSATTPTQAALVTTPVQVPIEVEQTPDWDAIAAESAGSQLSFIEKDSQPPVG